MPPRILIVDDEESIVFAMRRYFQLHGFDVDAARELEEAQALVANVRYAVVIADLRLTGVHGAEGLDLVAYVRERCPWTRTMLLTAHSSPDIEVAGRERGVDMVLRKPRPLPDVAQAVMTLLAKEP